MTPKPSKIEAKRRPKTDCKSGRQKNDQKYEKVPKMVLKMVSQGWAFSCLFGYLRTSGRPWGPTWLPDAPPEAPRPQNVQILTTKCSKMEPICHPKWSKVPRVSLFVPFGLLAPLWPAMGSNMAPRRAPGGPKTPKISSFGLLNAPNWNPFGPQNDSKSRSKWIPAMGSNMAPRRPRGGPKSSTMEPI